MILCAGTCCAGGTAERARKLRGRLLVLVQALTSPKLAAVNDAAGRRPGATAGETTCYLVCPVQLTLWSVMAGCRLLHQVMCDSPSKSVTKLVMHCRHMPGWPSASSAW